MLTQPIALAALASAISGASAFSNSFPFAAFASEASLDFAVNEEMMTQSSPEIAATLGSVYGCPADAYILVNQPGVHASDLRHDAPHLSALLSEAESSIESSYMLYDAPAVLDQISDSVVNHCGGKKITVDTRTGGFPPYVDTAPRVISLDFDPLSTDKSVRRNQLRDNDAMLYSVTTLLPSRNYIIVYTAQQADSTSGDSSDSSSSSDSAFKITGTSVREEDDDNKDNNKDDNKDGKDKKYDSLFVNYQFLSPGIWMTMVVSLLLLLVLLQAMSWIAELQVSYKAFEPAPTREKASS